jgi:outer membrane protein TolC
MNTIRKIVNLKFLLLYSFLIASAYSQASETRKLTIEEAVQLAIKQNPDLESVRLDVKRSDARVLEAWGYAMPSVDVSGQYMHFLDKPVSFFPDVFLYGFMKEIDSTIPKPTGKLVPVSFTPGFMASASLNVKQILFNGAIFVGIGAAQVYSHLARDIYEAKQVETITKVKKAYYSALLAYEALELMRSSLKNAEDNLKNVQLMKEQGIVSEYDELRASVGVENLRPVVIQSETIFNLARDALRNIIGISTKEDFILADSLHFHTVDAALLERAEELVQEMNPNITVVKRQIELNGAIINAERTNYLPTIIAFGSYQYQAAMNKFNFSTNDFFKSSQFGLSISLSLFQGLQTYARVQQAQLDKRKSEEQLNSLERNLHTALRSITGNLQHAKKRVEAQEKTVEMAERGYKIVTTKFLNNSATQLEINDAQLALTQSKVNRIQAVYDYLNAAADLDQLIGRLPGYVIEMND